MNLWMKPSNKPFNYPWQEVATVKIHELMCHETNELNTTERKYHPRGQVCNISVQYVGNPTKVKNIRNIRNSD